MDGCIKP